MTTQLDITRTIFPEVEPTPASDIALPSGFFRHHGMWAPGVRAFRRVGFAAKAASISVAFLVPLAMLGWNYFATKQHAVSDTNAERAGVEFAKVVLSALDDARKLRGVTLQAATTGGKSAELVAATHLLERDFGAIEAADQRLGATFGTHDATTFAKAAWQSAAPATTSAAGILQTHGTLSAALRDLLSQVSDGSGLTLDPDLDTYYLMDAALGAMPSLLEQSARLHVQAAAVSRTGQGGEAGSAALLRADGVLQVAAAQLHSDLMKVVGVHPELAEAFETDAALRELGTLRASVFVGLTGGANDAAAEQIHRSGAAMSTRLSTLEVSTLAALDELLGQRVDRIRRDMAAVASLLLVSLAVSAYLFRAFYLVMNGGMAEVRRHLDRMAQGDLTTTPSPWGQDEAAQLLRALGATQDAIRRIVAKVRAASTSIVAASTQIASGAEHLAVRTERSAANLQLSAASIEEISTTVQQTASAAKQAAELAAGNKRMAERGGQVIRGVVDTMHRIDASSRRIADIIGVIDSIAFQTNILALNAAVESARAGDAGRGFAVVAAEVRTLAQRVAAASSEVRSLILASVDEVRSGTGVVDGAGEAIECIVDTSRRVSHLLLKIATSADEQARGVCQSAQAVQDLDGATQQNAALVEQTAAAAAALQSQSCALADEVDKFVLP